MKETLFVPLYLRGTEFRVNTYKIFSQLGAEGYTHVKEGDQANLWVSKHPLPDLDYTRPTNEVDEDLYELGFTTDDLAVARPDLLEGLE